MVRDTLVGEVQRVVANLIVLAVDLAKFVQKALLGLGETVSTLVGCVVAVLGSFPSSVSAQAVRGWVGSTVQAVEIRPMGAVGGTYDPLDEVVSLAATQDLSLTAWGFGVQGLSATAYFRNRARLGSDLLWPRTDDRFDVLTAYAQWVRSGLVSTSEQ